MRPGQPLLPQPGLVHRHRVRGKVALDRDERAGVRVQDVHHQHEQQDDGEEDDHQGRRGARHNRHFQRQP